MEKPLALCLTETHITEDILDQELIIENYNVYRCNSNSKHTGGILLYVYQEISVKLIENMAKNYEYWFLYVRLKVNSSLYELCMYYRSPSGNIVSFLNFFESKCECLWDTNNTIIHIGDFNLNYLNEDFYVLKFKQIVNLNGLKQLILEPTRITNTTKSLIDLIISNDHFLTTEVRQVPKISDHDWILFKTNFIENQEEKTKIIKYVDYRKLDIELNKCNWDSQIEDINILFEKLTKNVEECINRISVEKLIKVRGKPTPWFNKTIIEAQKIRNLNYTKFLISGNNIDWEEYKKSRNNCLQIIRKEKINYFQEEIDNNKNNGKKMWKTLQNLVKPKSKFNIKEMFFGNKKETNEIVIAEKLNLYYVNSINEIIVSIDKGDDSICPKINRVSSCLENFRKISIQDLKNKIWKLNSNQNYSEILNKKVMKEAFRSLGDPLLHLINYSLKKGEIPEKLKCSFITPVQKVKNTKKWNEYRPVNVLWDIEKVFESVVYDQISDFIEENKILVEMQAGFRKKRSTETALQYVIESWKRSLDGDEIVIAVFLDFKRAFETIDRNVLLTKLHLYGFRNIVHKWFKNYLNGRSQITKINSAFSTELLNHIGVPQGSILGPLLFILYINDMVKVLNYCKIQMFADDTLIFISGKKISECVSKLNYDLKLISNWLKVNKLKLNPSKSKYMILGNHNYDNRLNIVIDEENLEVVNSFKYLGILIDFKLKFDLNNEVLIKKIATKVSYFKRVSRNLSIFSKKIIYNTIILPHFLYCSTVLYNANDVVIKRLQILQNKIMRIILNANKYTKISYMLKKLEWLNVKNLIFYLVCIFIYKIQYNILPNNLKDFTILNLENHHYETRHNNNFYLRKISKNCTYKSIFYKGLNDFNNLKGEIKMQKSLKNFKTKLKSYLFLKQISEM